MRRILRPSLSLPLIRTLTALWCQLENATGYPFFSIKISVHKPSVIMIDFLCFQFSTGYFTWHSDTVFYGLIFFFLSSSFVYIFLFFFLFSSNAFLSSFLWSHPLSMSFPLFAYILSFLYFLDPLENSISFSISFCYHLLAYSSIIFFFMFFFFLYSYSFLRFLLHSLFFSSFFVQVLSFFIFLISTSNFP